MNHPPLKTLSNREPQWRIGSHMRYRKTLLQTLQQAHAYSMRAVQISLGPRTYRRKEIPEDQILKAVEFNTQIAHIPLFIHTAYLFNLCGSKQSLAWNGDPKQDEKTQKAIQAIQFELAISSRFEESGVVVSQSRSGGPDSFMALVAENQFTE